MIYHIRLILLYTDFLGAKVDLKNKIHGQTINMQNYPACRELNLRWINHFEIFCMYTVNIHKF